MTERTHEQRTVGVIGAGKIASSAHLPVLHNIESVEVGYVADIDGARAKRMGRSYGANGIEISDAGSLPACDVALLAVPVTVREPYLAEFGSRGTPIFSEKPFAIEPNDHRRYLELTDEVSCNYLRVCFGSTRRARELVQMGVFGDVKRVVCREGGIAGATGQSSSGFAGDEALRDRHMLLDRSCHGLSQILHIFAGGELEVRDAEMQWQRGFDVDLQAELSLSYRGREIPVAFELTQVRPIEPVFRIECESAVVKFDTAAPEAQLSVSGVTDDRSVAFKSHPDAASTFAQAAYLRWTEFIESLDEPGSEGIETAPEITETMTEMFDRATEARGA